MNLVSQVFFYLCATLALFGAIAAVAARNPIRGALGLLVMILSIAGLYLSLSAQFLAAIQLIVYAGAVVVLFLFVIMLLGPDATGDSDVRGLAVRVFGGGLFGLASLAGIYAMVKGAHHVRVVKVPSEFGGVDAFGRELFTQGLVPFELSSALLMVSVLGAVAIARGRQGLPAKSASPTTPAPIETKSSATTN